MNKSIIQPTYFTKFSCIASNCKDHCCQGWGIRIDKNIYKKYKKMQNKSVRKMLLNNLEVINLGDANYAKIKLHPQTKLCPFFDEDGLCYMHKNLGEHSLSLTCKQFPRILNIVDGEPELSLTPACEEAARLIMDNPDGIEFELSSNNASLMIGRKYLSTTNDPTNFIKIKYPTLRPLFIEILQYREFSINHRLMLLGFLCKKLNVAKSTEEIDNICNSFINDINHGIYDHIADDIQGEEIILKQLEIINELGTNVLKNHFTAKKLTELQVEFEHNFIDSETQELNTTKYLKYHKITEDFINKNEYLIENYFVNYIFSKFLILCDRNNILEQFTLIGYRLFIFKYYLTSHACTHDKIEKDNAIRIITAIARGFDHGVDINKIPFLQLKSDILDTMIVLVSK